MREKVLEKLKEINIKYKLVEHTPVYTIEEMDALGEIFDNAKICKNLFLRDQKGKRHFLIVVPEEKRVPLSEIPEKIGSTRLSFASEERLMKYLKLTPGSVTPLAVINDEENEVGIKCIAGAILNNDRTPIGAVSITAPAVKMTDETIEEYAVLLKEAVETISLSMGYGIGHI